MTSGRTRMEPSVSKQVTRVTGAAGGSSVRAWWQPLEFLLASRGQERLAQKVTLTFGFMACLPVLFMAGAFVVFVLPSVQGTILPAVSLFAVAAITSIFVGYSVLKRTMRSVLAVVNETRKVTEQRLAGVVEKVNGDGGDEIVELARTFHRVTNELERKVEALESSRALIKRLLSRIGTVIVSYEGIETILELIMEQTSAALEAQGGSLLLVDGQVRELELKAAWPTNGHLQPANVSRLAVGEGIAGWVAKRGTPMRGTGSPSAIGLQTSGSEGAVLCVPLAIREHLLGVMALFREDATRSFTEDDEVLLANIGSQVAVAIENARLNLDMERAYLETVTALALAVEARDAYSAGHSKRVGLYAVKIAEAMGVMDEDAKKVLSQGGLLHDVGKIGIKDEILLKAGPLTPEERRIMRQHSVIGYAILKPLRSLQKVAELVEHHHESYDGSGYPSGLKGDAIPLGARIVSVADAYDSMVTDRPYRKRMTLEQARAELCKGAGSQFDPDVVAAFLKILEEKTARMAHSGS